MHATIRHQIVKYLTDRPGAVVYRDEIVEFGDFTETQVSAAILNVQRSSPIGPEIQTIIAGNAWRYVPNVTPSSSPQPQPQSQSQSQPSSVNGHRPTQRKTLHGDRPLTWRIRDYLAARPHVVVNCDELVEHTGVNEEKVRIGLNNMRSNHGDFGPYVETVVGGQSWRYAPPVRKTDVANVVTPPTRATVDATGRDVVPRLFEEVGTTNDGGVIIRDDDGALYHATKI